MKHSPMLLLGLSSLALSSAPAYADSLNSLNFDPSQSTLDRPHLLAQSAKLTHSRFESSSDGIVGRTDRAERHLPQTKPTPQPAPLAESKPRTAHNTPLFVPPADWEQPPAAERQPQTEADQSPRSANLRAPQEDEPAIETPFEFPADASDTELFEADPPSPTPFEFPARVSDMELFEAESAPPTVKERQTSTDPSLDFASADQFEQLFDSLQPDRSTTQRSRQPDRQPNRQDDLNLSPRQRNADRSEAGAKSGDRTKTRATRAIGLSFEPAPSPPAASESVSTMAAIPSSKAPPASATAGALENAAPDKVNQAQTAEGDPLNPLFVGESDSLVAIAVGSAEGTRTPDGSKNSAYQGHVDPGNGVWNLGSFSYQHGANSPEEADTKQLARLRTQASAIFEKATAKGLNLTLEEKLNGIDLANQAPKAALEQHGYIDRLAEAYSRGLSGNEAILWARVQSFIDPRTQTWDAPGLGNSEDRITRDQERRMLAIAQAIANYLQDVAKRPVTPSPEEQATQRSPPESGGIAQLFTQLFQSHS